MLHHFDTRHISGFGHLLWMDHLQHIPLLKQFDNAIHPQDIFPIKAIVMTVQHEQMLEMNDIVFAILMKNMTSLIQSIRFLARIHPNSTQRFLDTQEYSRSILFN